MRVRLIFHDFILVTCIDPLPTMLDMRAKEKLHKVFGLGSVPYEPETEDLKTKRERVLVCSKSAGEVFAVSNLDWHDVLVLRLYDINPCLI